MQSIPKVIHYCWFGQQPHPPAVVRCMDSWRRLLPNYRIIEWNESNTDLTTNRYVREAYAAQKYAFVTDYVRLRVLFEHGGVYMDTDVEVVRSLDAFLRHDAFSGFENENEVPTAVMGSRSGNRWIGALLAEYDELAFVKPDGTFDVTTNVARISATTRDRFGVPMDNEFHELPGVLTMYPREVFCPKSYATGVITRTSSTHAIHHFAGSWKPVAQRQRRELRGRLNRLLGVRAGGWVFAIIHVWQEEGAAAIPLRLFRSLSRPFGRL